MINLATPQKSGWYRDVWIHYFPTLNTYVECGICGDTERKEGKYSIMKNLGKGQEYTDFCNLEHAKQFIREQNPNWCKYCGTIHDNPEWCPDYHKEK
jgi:hypothetical protein